MVQVCSTIVHEVQSQTYLCSCAVRPHAAGILRRNRNRQPPAREVSFDVVACRVEETNGACEAPLAGATVKVRTRLAPDGSSTFTPPQTTNEAGYTFFTLTGDAAQLQESLLVITAPGHHDRSIAVQVPSLAQPGSTTSSR